jgi:hypothetical protein
LSDDLFEPPAGLGANGFRPTALEGAVGACADEAEGAVASATRRTGMGGEEPGQPGAGDRGGNDLWVLGGLGVNAVVADGASETPGAELLLEAALCEMAGAAALLQGTLRAPWAPQRRLC